MIVGALKELRPGEIASSFAVVWGPHFFTAHSKVQVWRVPKREREDGLKKTCYSLNNNVRKAGSTSDLEVTCNSSACAYRGVAAI